MYRKEPSNTTIAESLQTYITQLKCTDDEMRSSENVGVEDPLKICEDRVQQKMQAIIGQINEGANEEDKLEMLEEQIYEPKTLGEIQALSNHIRRKRKKHCKGGRDESTEELSLGEDLLPSSPEKIAKSQDQCSTSELLNSIGQQDKQKSDVDQVLRDINNSKTKAKKE